MQRYALLGNKLYTVPAGSMRDAITSGEMFRQPIAKQSVVSRTTFNKVTNHHYVGLSIYEPNVLSNTVDNQENVDKAVQFIIDQDITEILTVNPECRVEIEYVITDGQGTELERSKRIRICQLSEVFMPKAITPDDALNYSIIAKVSGTVDIDINKDYGLGLSKPYNNPNYILKIENFVVRIATTGEPVYSKFLSTAQQNIGWSVTSPTQEQLNRHDLPIYDLKGSGESANMPVIEMDDRLTNITVQFDFYSELFVYTHTSHTIEQAVIEQQKKKMTYSVHTGFMYSKLPEAPGVIDTPVLTDLAYGEEVIVKATPNEGYKINFVKFVRNNDPNNTELIELTWDSSNIDLDLDFLSDFFATPGDLSVHVDPEDTSGAIEIHIDAIDCNYDIYVSISKIPEEPKDPDETDPGNKRDPDDSGLPVPPDSNDDSDEDFDNNDIRDIFDQNTPNIG